MRRAIFVTVIALGLAGCGGGSGDGGDTGAGEQAVPSAGDENVKVSEGETEVEVVGPGGEPADLPPPPEK